MANATIPELTALGAAVAVGDLLEIADVSNANASRKVTQAELVANLGTPTTLVGTNITGTAAGLTAGAASSVSVLGITGMGAGVADLLAAFSSENMLASLTTSTGTGNAVFSISPTFTGTVTMGTLAVTTASVTALNPVSNDGAPLGTTALGWSDLHLATGALINVANGNAVITHSSGIFTVSTGDFRITTAGTNTASAVTVGGTQSLTNKKLGSLTTNGFVITGSGDGTLSVTVPGTGVLTQLGLAADGSDVDAIGFRGVPQNAQTGNYTLVMADAGKHIFHASGAGAGDTYTIPANASVAFEIGTTITFVNADSNSISIAITTDTMTLAGTTTTGTRTLAQNGVATAIKTTSTTWIINGTGLT